MQFDLHSSTSTGPPTPAQIRDRREQNRVNTPAPSSSRRNRGDDESDESTSHPRRHRRGRDKNKHDSKRDQSPGDSDSTEDLPDRFDRHGRKIPERGEDPLADKFEDLLGGKGSVGKLLKNFGLGKRGSDDEGTGVESSRRGDKPRRRRRDSR